MIDVLLGVIDMATRFWTAVALFTMCFVVAALVVLGPPALVYLLWVWWLT